MQELNAATALIDKNDRRAGIDRRKVSLPWIDSGRRAGQDRRSGLERRIRKENVVNIFERRGKTRESVEVFRFARGVFFGILLSLPLWAIIIIAILLIRAR